MRTWSGFKKTNHAWLRVAWEFAGKDFVEIPSVSFMAGLLLGYVEGVGMALFLLHGTGGLFFMATPFFVLLALIVTLEIVFLLGWIILGDAEE